jgi:hypothetical protein
VSHAGLNVLMQDGSVRALSPEQVVWRLRPLGSMFGVACHGRVASAAAVALLAELQRSGLLRAPARQLPPVPGSTVPVLHVQPRLAAPWDGARVAAWLASRAAQRHARPQAWLLLPASPSPSAAGGNEHEVEYDLVAAK